MWAKGAATPARALKRWVNSDRMPMRAIGDKVGNLHGDRRNPSGEERRKGLPFLTRKVTRL